jgi:hypothetical protein
MIELSICEYESIRSSPVRFPVKLGHDYPEFERVVEEREHYAIVEKCGQGKDFEGVPPRRASRRGADRRLDASAPPLVILSAAARNACGRAAGFRLFGVGNVAGVATVPERN